MTVSCSVDFNSELILRRSFGSQSGSRQWDHFMVKKKIYLFTLVSFSHKTEVMKKMLSSCYVIWGSYKHWNKEEAWENREKNDLLCFAYIYATLCPFHLSNASSGEAHKTTEKAYNNFLERLSLDIKHKISLKNSAFFSESFFYCKSFLAWKLFGGEF